MKAFLLIIAIACVLVAGSNSGQGSTGAAVDSNVMSATPPSKKVTNPIGIVLAETTIGRYDGLKTDNLKNQAVRRAFSAATWDSGLDAGIGKQFLMPDLFRYV